MVNNQAYIDALQHYITNKVQHHSGLCYYLAIQGLDSPYEVIGALVTHLNAGSYSNPGYVDHLEGQTPRRIQFAERCIEVLRTCNLVPATFFDDVDDEFMVVPR